MTTTTTAIDTIRIQLSPSSWIDEFALPEEIEGDFENMWNAHPEEYGLVKLFGKVHKTPRWQQTYGRAYAFSGMDHPALPIPVVFQPVWDWAVKSEYGPFNQMLVNWYENGHHHIGKHRE